MLESSIMILTRNEERNIGSCLEAVYAQKGVRAFEVLLVDSGSTDATVKIAGRFPARIEKIPSHAFHYAGTRNFAARRMKGNILVMLAGDAVPTSDLWLNHMLSNFVDPAVGAVYGRQLPKSSSGTERHATFETVYGDKRIVKDPAHRNGLGYRFYHFSDANAAIRRSVWETTPFPEDLKTFEDLGIAKRILDSGWKIVYEPKAAVFHSHSYTAWGLLKRYFDIGYTMKRLGIWEAPGTRSSMVKDLRKLLERQLTPAGNNIQQNLLYAALCQNLAKSAGLILGLNQRYLPLAVKRRLSAYRVFD